MELWQIIPNMMALHLYLYSNRGEKCCKTRIFKYILKKRLTRHFYDFISKRKHPKSLKVTWERSVVFAGNSAFLHQ
jgi:hypothetical protein